MTRPQTTNTLIHLAISAVDAKTLPVLLEISDGGTQSISLSVAMYARYLQREGLRSYETIRKYVSAIGKLKDYYTLEYKGASLESSELGLFLEKFLHAFDHGSVLGWTSATQNEYVLCRTAVLEYLKFVMDQSDGIWPKSEIQFLEDCRTSWTSVKYAQQSLLFHTKKRLRKKTGGRKKSHAGLRQYKQFPPRYIDALLEETTNPRDRLLFSVLAFGSRRASEVLHAFTQDVFTVDEKLQFLLAHPTHSQIKWQSLSGAIHEGIRRDYLRAQFSLLARTEHGQLPTALGWKGIKFDNEATKISETYFIRNADSELVSLHRTYIHQVRQRLPKRAHPYYWVNEDGEPLTMKAAEKQFSLAKKRIEKRFGIDLNGFGLHSLRHYYGFYCVDVLKVDLLLLQKWMGHVQVTSTAVYAHMSAETARNELKKAEQKRLDGIDQKTAASPLGAYGRAAIGEIDTKTLQRKLK